NWPPTSMVASTLAVSVFGFALSFSGAAFANAFTITGANGCGLAFAIAAFPGTTALVGLVASTAVEETAGFEPPAERVTVDASAGFGWRGTTTEAGIVFGSFPVGFLVSAE